MSSPSRPVDAMGVALAATGILTVGIFALTESFAELPAAVAAYAAAWWVLKLGEDAPNASGETR
jgi:hypothetical protein